MTVKIILDELVNSLAIYCNGKYLGMIFADKITVEELENDFDSMNYKFDCSIGHHTTVIYSNELIIK